jgi:hypothetical protein
MTYAFLDASIDFSDAQTEISDWNVASATPVATGTEKLTHVELVGCLKRTLWTRYLKSAG